MVVFARRRRRPVAALCAAVWALAFGSGAGATPPDGFIALFNGQDLTGWKGLVGDPLSREKMSAEELAAAQAQADEKMRAHWSVADGVLRFDGQGESLCTAADFADFELRLDWKITPGGDSGVYLRGSPQVQIWDNPIGSGGLYNNQAHPSAPLRVADRPVGEWNTFRIFMVGSRATVYLNGVLVVDDTVLENYWDRARPVFPVGQIELQAHGTPLEFRNVLLRPLSVAAYPEREVLQPGARVAIVGDSITEQRLYSRFVETYLLACMPELDARVIQLGWGGERAPGFAARMANDLLPWKPTVVTTCYGMNDGAYRAYEAPIGQAYAEAMTQIVRGLKGAGATVLVGSPGAVDFHTFSPAWTQGLTPEIYNANLATLRDLARELAWREGMPFANVHDRMILAQMGAKPALGDGYHVCGSDGFHPAANGHVVMAYAFLRGLRVPGQIGTIEFDAGEAGSGGGGGGGASVSAGHRVVGGSLAGASGGAWSVEVESTRYPFCFAGDTTSPDSPRSILPFVPFNEDLNRLVLRVRGLSAPRAAVSWGLKDGRTFTRTFTREQLEAGINLAAEFADNPFSEAFARVEAAVARKQEFETRMIKEWITRLPALDALSGGDAEARVAGDALRARLMSRHEALHAEARGAVTPVRHVIGIVPEA